MRNIYSFKLEDNVNKLIIGNLNINSISSKFDELRIIVEGKVDILIAAET